MFLQRIKVLIGSLAAVAMIFSATPAFAANDVEILLSPGDQKLELKPGETTSGKFKIFNIGKKSFSYEVSASPLTVSGKNYEYSYTKETNYTQISKWISFSKSSGKLDPGKNVEVDYIVKVPHDVPYGGQYAVIFASTKDGGDSGNVVVTKSVGMKLYARVPGETRESGSIIDNTIAPFFFKPPLFASATVKSTSNVDITAHYNLEVRNLLTGQLAFATEPGAYDKVLLPDTEYTSKVQWEGAPQLGIFRVRQTVKVLDQTSTIEKIVIICPIWLIFVIFLIIFLGIFWIASRIKSRRSARQANNY